MTETFDLPSLDWSPLPIHVRGSSDGRRLVIAGQTGVVSVLDLEGAALSLRSFAADPGESRERAGIEMNSSTRFDLALTPNGRWLAWGSVGGLLRVVDLATLAERGEGEPLPLPTPRDAEAMVLSVALHPTGELIALGLKREDRRWVEVRERESFALLGRFAFGSWPTRIGFSPDGGWLAATGGSRMMHLWDLSAAPPRCVARHALGSDAGEQVATFGFDANAAYFAEASAAVHRIGYDGTLEANWHRPTSGETAMIPTFAVSGERWVCGTSPGVAVMATADGTPLWQSREGAGTLPCLADDGTLSLFDPFDRRLRRVEIAGAASPPPTAQRPTISGPPDWDGDHYRDVPAPLFGSAADSYLASLAELERLAPDRDPADVERYRDLLGSLALVFAVHGEVIDAQGRLLTADLTRGDDDALPVFAEPSPPIAPSPDRLIDQLRAEDFALIGPELAPLFAAIHGEETAQALVGISIMARGAWTLEAALREAWDRGPLTGEAFAAELRRAGPFDCGALTLCAPHLMTAPDLSPLLELLRDEAAEPDARAAAALVLGYWDGLGDEPLDEALLEDARTLRNIVRSNAVRLRML